MGYYIERTSKGVPLSARGKANQLISDGATELFGFEIRFQPNLVCVVENGPFDAAGWAFSKDEFNVFNDPNDPRRKRWLIHPKAEELAK
jgi:hypothetical protein